MARRRSLSTVAAAGDQLETLRTLRDLLAAQIESTDSSRDVAALAARLSAVLAEVAQIEQRAPVAQSPVDEIAARRSRRRPLKDGKARDQA